MTEISFMVKTAKAGGKPFEPQVHSLNDEKATTKV